MQQGSTMYERWFAAQKMAYGRSMTRRTIPLLLAAALAACPAAALAAAPTSPKAEKAAAQTEAPRPLTVKALLARSQAASAKGDVQLALRLAQSAIVADPAQPGSYVALGDIYAHQGDSEYARSYYQAALGIDPTDKSALQAMAALPAPPADDTATIDAADTKAPASP